MGEHSPFLNQSRQKMAQPFSKHAGPPTDPGISHVNPEHSENGPFEHGGSSAQQPDSPGQRTETEEEEFERLKKVVFGPDYESPDDEESYREEIEMQPLKRDAPPHPEQIEQQWADRPFLLSTIEKEPTDYESNKSSDLTS